jgi:hypothetical protein
MLHPRSSWPKLKNQRYYTCELCGGGLKQTCELQFANGSVEPTVGETLTGSVSGEEWIVDSVALESGSWAAGNAVGTICLSKG